MKKRPQITKIIQGAIRRAGMTMKEVSQAIGVPYNTMLYRFNDPGTWRLHEFGALQRHVEFMPEELGMIECLAKKGELRK